MACKKINGSDAVEDFFALRATMRAVKSAIGLAALAMAVAATACSAVDPEPDPWSHASCVAACKRDYPEDRRERDRCIAECDP